MYILSKFYIRPIILSILFYTVLILPYYADAKERLLYIHTDHRNSPALMTYTNGKLAWQGEFTPSGKLHKEQSKANLTIPIRLFNSYYDPETGFFEMNGFKYSSVTGRFISAVNKKKLFTNTYLVNDLSRAKGSDNYNFLNKKFTRNASYLWANGLRLNYAIPNPLLTRKIYWKDKKKKEWEK